MKNKTCPNKTVCYDYNANNCEGCTIGNLIIRQKKRIKRLTAENVALKARLAELKGGDKE